MSAADDLHARHALVDRAALATGNLADQATDFRGTDIQCCNTRRQRNTCATAGRRSAGKLDYFHLYLPTLTTRAPTGPASTQMLACPHQRVREATLSCPPPPSAPNGTSATVPGCLRSISRMPEPSTWWRPIRSASRASAASTPFSGSKARLPPSKYNVQRRLPTLAAALALDCTPGHASSWLTSCETSSWAPSPVISIRPAKLARIETGHRRAFPVDHEIQPVALPNGKRFTLHHVHFKPVGRHHPDWPV
jgi:hypothetical protein